VYDGLGRRLRTIHTPVGTNVIYAAQTLVTDSFYDPQVEFLELAVSLNGQRTWKVIGPDINGGYGSMQGVGGLEATIRETDGLTTPVINDYLGNVVATVSETNANWNPVRVGGYGAVNGYQVESLTPSVPLAETLVWRSRRIDPSGFYYLGARYYDPLAGRFLSPDPLGHTASMSLYDFCSGDPLNSFDPDGRLSARSTQSGIENAPPPYELGIAPEMRSYVDVFHENPDGTLTSGDVLRAAGEDDPKQFWRVTEPTGNIFSYVRDTREGGPLADPDYGHYRREEITADVYFQYQQQQRLQFLQAVPTILLSLDGAGAFFEGGGARLLAGDAFAAETTVFRVEGLPNTRFVIGDAGQVSVAGNDSRMLWLNVGQEARAQEWLAMRETMPGVQLKSFQVPQSQSSQKI
jgi:RHS repeat-associated protein